MSVRSDHETAALPSRALGAGLLLLGASVLEILAMAHHPSVARSDSTETLAKIAEVAPLSRWVHGILIGLLLVITYGFSEFVLRSGPRRPLIRAGSVAYFAGVIIMIIAALVSGWMVGNVAALTPHATEIDRQIGGQLLTLCSIVNQACASCGAVAMSAGIGLWSLDLLRKSGAQRAVGLLGVAVCVVVIVSLIGAVLRLDVHGMSLVVLLQALWGVAVGVLLMRGMIR